MSLSTRLAAAMIALVILTAAAVGGLTYRNLVAGIVPSVLDRLDSHVQLLALSLDPPIREARGDVTGFQSGVAVNGIVRTILNGGTHPDDGSTLAQWHDRFAARLRRELTVKPDYLQLSMVGLADGGREIVRVERAVRGGEVRVVPASERRQIGERPYFQRTIRLRAEEADISPVELQRVNDAIKMPPVPIIRVATPVFSADGRLFGMVVVTIDLQSTFAHIRTAATTGAQVIVVDNQGNYLVHPDRTREFGFEFGKLQRLQIDFPETAAALSSDRTAPRIIEDPAGNRFGMALAPVKLTNGPRFMLAETMPYASIVANTIAIRNSSLQVGLIAVIVATILAVVLARSFTRPLVQMTRAIEDFGSGKPAAIPAIARGEMGVLARAFDQMIGEVRDKIKTQEALTQQIEERRRIFETSQDLIFVTDSQGTFIQVSPSATAILGYQPEEMVGRHAIDFIYPGDLDSTREEMRAARRGGVMRNFTTRYPHKDGHVVVLEWTGVWSEPVQRHFFIGRDLTEKLAAEAQFRQGQKMEAIGQLTGGIAHDFNNILTVIGGTIEVLTDGIADRPKLAALAKMIDEAAGRGADLTQSLLAFARRQPLQPRETNVNALLDETAKLLRPTLGEHIEIEQKPASDAWPALVDASQLTTALLNLALNARDAMPNGGKLMLETRNVVLDEAYAAAHSEVRPGEYVMVAVSDTGHGIPEAVREKVFEPFFTTKEVGQGTGLGLSMVYGFVKQSDGHIKVYSEEGHGTTIKIYLPRTAAGAVQMPDVSADEPAEGGHETVLVVEDDAMVRNHVVAQLQSLGYTTLLAGNAAEALAIFENGTAFDLLFTDIIMPGKLNGRQLADELRRRRPSLKVLFTSGYTENAIVHHGRLDPGVHLLAKPYRKSQLARMVRVALSDDGTMPASKTV